jgi:hypothetical protein
MHEILNYLEVRLRTQQDPRLVSAVIGLPGHETTTKLNKRVRPHMDRMSALLRSRHSKLFQETLQVRSHRATKTGGRREHALTQNNVALMSRIFSLSTSLSSLVPQPCLPRSVGGWRVSPGCRATPRPEIALPLLVLLVAGRPERRERLSFETTSSSRAARPCVCRPFFPAATGMRHPPGPWAICTTPALSSWATPRAHCMGQVQQTAHKMRPQP